MKKTVIFIVFLLIISGLIRFVLRFRPQAVKKTIKVGGIERVYYLHVPVSTVSSGLLPLVMAFHGGGGLPVHVERETGFNKLADREGFVVAYPEGIGRSWNDGRRADTIAAQKAKIDDVGFIRAMIEEISKNHKIDRTRIYATGISNGGMFSHYLGFRLSSHIAAIAPVVGGIADHVDRGLQPEEPVSVMIMQGVEDPLVPYSGGAISFLNSGVRGRIISTEAAAKRWQTHNSCNAEARFDKLPDKVPDDGCQVETYTYEGGKNGTTVVLYKIVGGGHTWPDGRQYLPKSMIGTVCRDFNATEVIWDFFKKHPKIAGD